MSLVALVSQPGNPWAQAWREGLSEAGHEVWEVNEYSEGVQRDILSRRPTFCVPLVLDEDVLAKRQGALGSRFDAALALERSGAKMLNSTSSIAKSADKLRAAREFARYDLPHPKTIAIENHSHWPFAGWAILKPAHSSSGMNIHLVSSETEAREISRGWKSDPLLQQWVENPRCYRIIATAESCIYAIEKRAPEGELVAATNFGAERIYIDPSPAMQKMAQETIQALGGGVMGVDILERDGQMMVLEANPAFAFDLNRPSLRADLASLVR